MAKVRNPIEPKYLYRYRSIEDGDKLCRELKSICDHTLWGSQFLRLNDPMEGTYNASAHLVKHRNYAAMKDFIFGEKAALGICSFSETNDNPIMWAHYADQFTGICIRYDFDRLKRSLPDDVEFARVKYSESAQEIRLDSLREANLAKSILSTKGQTWLYEREWRMFSPQADANVTASIICVSGVYVGSRIDGNKRQHVEAVLRGKNIPVSKMKLDGYSIKFESHGRKPA
jgi:hypothetical protein